MKTIFIFQFASLLLLLTISCKQAPKKGEPIVESVKQQNDAKFVSNKKESDANFLVQAVEMDMAQINLGKLAQQIGSKSIKDLGMMMEKQHTKSLTEAIELAKSKMMIIPEKTSFNDQDAYNTLNAKSSVDFDKMYTDMVVNAHKEAIDLYEKTVAEGNDQDIKQWAEKSIPNLKTHLEHAEMLQKK